MKLANSQKSLTISEKKKIHYSTEAVARRCFGEKLFLKVLQNSLESTCVGVSLLIKLQAGLRLY